VGPLILSFIEGKNLEPEDIEDILFEVMKDEFGAVLEDGSEIEVKLLNGPIDANLVGCQGDVDPFPAIDQRRDRSPTKASAVHFDEPERPNLLYSSDGRICSGRRST
jgi:hypothetical protein